MTYPWASGDVLTASDLNNAISGAGGLVLIDKYEITATVAYVDMNSIFSADHDAYRIMLTGSSHGTTYGGNIRLYLGNSGTPDTSSNYHWIGVPWFYASNSFYGSTLGGNPDSGWTAGFASIQNTMTMLYVDIHNPFVDEETFLQGWASEGNNLNDYHYWFGGRHGLRSSYTDLRVDPTGSFTSGGLISVYGYSK